MPGAPDAQERRRLEDLLLRGYRYALALTHDPTSAEDLVHDAWLAILAGGGPQHVGYLFATIRNRFLDAERRARLLVVESLGEPGEGTEQDAHRALDEEICLDLVVLEKALAGLRAEEREALFLMAVEGFTAAEVARLTGRPRGTVLSLVHRARVKIRELFHREDQERSA